MLMRHNFIRIACMLTIPVATGIVGIHFGRVIERLDKPPFIAVTENSVILPENRAALLEENIGKIEKETVTQFPVQSGEVPTGRLSLSIRDKSTVIVRFYHLGNGPDLLMNRSMEIMNFIDSRIEHYAALKERDDENSLQVPLESPRMPQTPVRPKPPSPR
jgi:hypothetical protein